MIETTYVVWYREVPDEADRSIKLRVYDDNSAKEERDKIIASHKVLQKKIFLFPRLIKTTTVQELLD